MNVKEQLKQYKYTKENIDELEERLYEIDSRFNRITQSFDPMPKGSEKRDKMSEMVVAKENLEKEINQELMKSYKLMAEIESCIKDLQEEEKRLIRLRYIDGLNWELICVKMCYSWRAIHYKHSDILKKISKT